ncbi:NPP1 family protein [Streptomonospora arabica]|uniref:NPP1 family protein n=1 Tax=Streptomonospora arabica TaxID=412417 RepID=A0ABV9SK15_9ACTN
MNILAMGGGRVSSAFSSAVRKTRRPAPPQAAGAHAPSPGRARAGRRRAGLALAAAAALAVLPASPAFADPPEALPADATAPDRTWQPAFDYDTDGCYPTPAIGADGTVATGLKTSGALNGSCRDGWDLDNTNSYARAKCDPSGWCAHMYALYFEKDQTVHGCCGHRHDLEHVIVWVKDDQARYVSASAHGDYDTRAASDIRWEGTHAKIVYHKDGASTHAFRFAADHDDPPENHDGTWQYPDLVSWNNFPSGIREKLVAADFGSARLALKDGNFEADLEKAEPSGIEFDPHA